jgi:tetratricopeptide (TPR) repeat protein
MKNAARRGNHPMYEARCRVAAATVGAVWILLSGCAGSGLSHAVKTTLDPVAKEHGGSLAAAVAIGEASVCVDRGAAEEAASWLHGALEYRDDLLDDSLFRDLISELKPAALSPALRAVRNTELARRELMGQMSEMATQYASAARANPSAPVLTQRRAQMVALLARPKAAVDPGAEAYAAEISRIRRQPIPGRLGASLKLRLAMLEAAVHQEKGRYQQAIKLYLTLPMDSGLYRSARLGLAWCQFQIGHTQRALKILALLPGGLSGDPERAVLAAMAAHGLGSVDAAREIIAEAQSQRPDLEAETVDVERVLSAISSGATRPLLRGPREGLTLMVASSAEVLAISKMLLSYRSSPVAQQPSSYGDKLAALLASRVDGETQRQLERLRRAWETLDRLAPQIL